ncbi:MAG: peroxidase, partial [Chloroflexota bacterium]|nr:peroxidase [Chloroflexota bacterium]
LGPVGARIVGEVLVGIVDRDPGSHRALAPAWRPTLPAATPGDFTLADLFAFVERAGSAAGRPAHGGGRD